MSSLSSLLGPYATQALSNAPLTTASPFSVPAISMWIAVRQRFAQFHANLTLTPLQFLDGVTKRNGVVNCLNRHYHDSFSETDNSFLIGSWGKDTAVRPPRDVDIYFLLPAAVYHRFQAHLWNRQSALLQEVKGA